jgi:hypothetical protein
MIEVLCIGGSMNGVRKRVRDRRAVIVGTTIEPGVGITQYRYDVERIMVERDWFFIAHPSGTDMRVTVARLIAGYGRAIGPA